jgi:hypothetical protein
MSNTKYDVSLYNGDRFEASVTFGSDDCDAKVVAAKITIVDDFNDPEFYGFGPSVQTLWKKREYTDEEWKLAEAEDKIYFHKQWEGRRCFHGCDKTNGECRLKCPDKSFN